MFKSAFIVARDGKLQLIKNVLRCIKGCSRDDEITLYSILE